MFAATLGFNLLDGDQAAAIVLFVNAAAAAVNAFTVRPLPVPVFTYALSTLISAFALYGLNITGDQVAGLNSVLVAVLGLLTYGNVSPVTTVLSKATTAQAAPEVQTVPEA
jgi:hypothetical protein